MITDNQFQKEKKNLMIIVGAAWVLCLGLIGALAVPFTMRIYQTKDSLDEGKLKLVSIKSDLSNGNKYRTLRESIGESKDLLERAVLKESTVVNFIQDLENTAKETGNEIAIAPYTPPKTKKRSSGEEESQPASQGNEEGKGGQYFQLTINAGYPQLLNFLAKLENMGYVFRINSIESKTKVGTNNVSLQNEQSQESTMTGNVESKIIISFSLQK